MPTFYFHIGMHKTGSTALQSWCARHRAELARAGLRYPDLPEPNHGNFYVTQFNPVRERYAERLRRRGKSTYFDRRTDVRERFERFLAGAAAEGADVLSSGEAASYLRPRALREIADVVGRHFDRVIVLALVRPPRSFAASLSQEKIKAGDSFDGLLERPPVPHYRRRFQSFIDVFGDDSLRLGIFHRERLREGCVLQTVLSMTDRDVSALAAARAPRANESIGMAAAKLLSAVHHAAREPGRRPDVPEPVLARLARWEHGRFLDGIGAFGGRDVLWPRRLRRRVHAIEGAPFAVPEAIQERVRDLSGEDVAWMSGRLGVDLAALDVPPTGVAPTLEECRRFNAAEVEAICRALDRGPLFDLAAAVRRLSGRGGRPPIRAAA